VKLGVIVSGGRVTRWQAEALRGISEGNQFVVYDCRNSKPSRRRASNAGYYLLNLLSVRSPATKMVRAPDELTILDTVRFDSAPDGAWECLPNALVARIRRDDPQVIVKFGMGLLRVPPNDQLPCPILSYHHGDPRRFRGRPAGFHELSEDAPALGQIVQILTNRLDAGQVVAFAETRIHSHSWRRTLADAFRVSPLLLPVAIRNAVARTPVPIDSNGRNYRLPSNGAAFRFGLGLWRAKARRYAYGAFVEKDWRVAEANLDGPPSLASMQALADSGRWTVAPVPAPFTFLADPFFGSSGEVFAEAMRRDGQGQIVRLSGGAHQVMPLGGGHLSYPFRFEWEGQHYLLPEMAAWSLPRIFEIVDGGMQERGRLELAGDPRLLDATLHVEKGTCFLFANREDEGAGVLRLWTATSPFDRFVEHPASPILVSPAGARMGGGILTLAEGRFRPGQDSRRGYGDGLILFRIEEISPTAYRESEAATLRFTSVRGPHTLNLRGNRALFDFYRDRLTPLAGWRRLRQARSA
jgi:hypothetical protein